MANIAVTSGWRLVHDNVNVIALFESSGITETIHTIYEAATEAECLAEVERLGLIQLTGEGQ